MIESHYFPPEVPSIDDAVIVIPTRDDLPSDYKFFCEESHVISRLFTMDHANREYIEVGLTGEKIKKICFNLKDGAWWTRFSGKKVTVQVKKILD